MSNTSMMMMMMSYDADTDAGECLVFDESICVCVYVCHLQGLAPLKTAVPLSGQQKPSLSATQPMLKSLPTVHSDLAGKVEAYAKLFI